MFHNTPEAIIRESAFSDKTMDMRVPFQRATESVKNADKTGDKVFGLVDLVEHTEDNTSDGSKKAVEKRAVLEKEMPQLLIDRENAMAVRTMDQLERHGIGTFLRVFDTASRAKRLLQRKGTNFNIPHWEQAYIAPPKEGSPQLIILSTLVMTDWRGCKIYNISS